MTQEREFGWDDEIEESGGNFTLLPAGDYNFTVEKFERARHQGSTNLPACPMALLTLKIDGGEHGQATVIHRLFLHSKTEGFLSNFFEAIGQKKEGERVKMNWQIVTGAKGRCTLEINEYTNKNGEERSNNQVKTFLAYDIFMRNQGGAPQQQPQYQQPAQQPQQQYQQAPPVQAQQPVQQPTQQTPFPTGQPQQTGQLQQGGFVPGQF